MGTPASRRESCKRAQSLARMKEAGKTYAIVEVIDGERIQLVRALRFEIAKGAAAAGRKKSL